jgi:hypothetical protein
MNPECPECGRDRKRVSREWLINFYGEVDDLVQYGLVCWTCPKVVVPLRTLNMCTVTMIRQSFHAVLRFPKPGHELEPKPDEVRFELRGPRKED